MNELQERIYDTRGAEPFKQFSKDDSVPTPSELVIVAGIVQFPHEAHRIHQKRDHHLRLGAIKQYMSDLKRSPRNHNNVDDNSKGSRRWSGGDLGFGLGDLENVESHRRDVRDRIMGPLTGAIRNWEGEGNRHIEDIRRILWGM